MVEPLRRDGFTVLDVPSGATLGQSVDVVLLHGESGDMRTDLVQLGGSTPVIVHLADTGLAAEVYLDAGADDCVSSSVGTHELLARVRALTRRPHRTRKTELLRRGPFCIDLVRQVFSNDGLPVRLPPQEFTLLELLLRGRGDSSTGARFSKLSGGSATPGIPRRSTCPSSASGGSSNRSLHGHNIC